MKRFSSVHLNHSFQTIKNVSGSRISHVSSAAVINCASEIKKLELGLTEAEIIQIVNLKPESEVEYYLVRIRFCGVSSKIDKSYADN
jgi:hypothetical protein